MPKHLICDKCGEGDASEYYDGSIILCTLHGYEYDLESMRDQYEPKMDSYLENMVKMRREMREVEDKIKELEKERYQKELQKKKS